DWILDGDDVARPTLVDAPDERGGGGALTGTRWSGHDHESLRGTGPGQDDLGQPELVEVGRVGDRAEDVGGAAALAEGAAAEAAGRRVVGQVGGAFPLE